MLEDVSSSKSDFSMEFKAKIRELKQAIQHHIQEEENEVFSQVAIQYEPGERSQLGSEFEVVKANCKPRYQLQHNHSRLNSEYLCFFINIDPI